MKKLITLLLITLPILCYTQKVTSWENVTYYGYPAVPVYSDWFKVEYIYKNDKDMTINVLPKNDKSFSLNTDGVKSKINEDIVRLYLLTSLNEFRDDYDLSHGIENEELTEICNDYTKTIKSIFTAKHSKFVKDYDYKINDGVTYVSEGIDYLPYNFFTIIPDHIDINKVIADYVFDSMVKCPAHAYPLVREYNIFEIGFGLDFREGGVMVVLQYMDKKG
tara:strand:+ start:59 stop:718 length:660 start_codon:yes stop_codon:yes gene_type:complete